MTLNSKEFWNLAVDSTVLNVPQISYGKDQQQLYLTCTHIKNLASSKYELSHLTYSKGRAEAEQCPWNYFE